MKEPGLKKRNILLKRLSAPWNYAWPINNPVNYILPGKKRSVVTWLLQDSLEDYFIVESGITHYNFFDAYA